MATRISHPCRVIKTSARSENADAQSGNANPGITSVLWLRQPFIDSKSPFRTIAPATRSSFAVHTHRIHSTRLTTGTKWALGSALAPLLGAIPGLSFDRRLGLFSGVFHKSKSNVGEGRRALPIRTPTGLPYRVPLRSGTRFCKMPLTAATAK